AAEGNGQMRVIAADAPLLVEGLPRCPGRSCVLVAEGDVAVDVIANGLNAPRAGGRLAEQAPRQFGQSIGLAISAAEEKDEALAGKIFDGVLPIRRCDPIGRTRIVHDRTGGQPELTLRGNDSAAPVAV